MLVYFIPDPIQVAHPLYNLMKRNMKGDWDQGGQGFDQTKPLKDRLTSAVDPTISMPLRA